MKARGPFVVVLALVAPSASACGGNRVSSAPDAGQQGDGSRGDASATSDADAGAALDASGDGLAGQPCVDNNDCIGTGGWCWGGFCCNGELVSDGGCRCGSGPGCDVNSICCDVNDSGSFQCQSWCTSGPPH